MKRVIAWEFVIFDLHSYIYIYTYIHTYIHIHIHIHHIIHTHTLLEVALLYIHICLTSSQKLGKKREKNDPVSIIIFQAPEAQVLEKNKSINK